MVLLHLQPVVATVRDRVMCNLPRVYFDLPLAFACRMLAVTSDEMRTLAASRGFVVDGDVIVLRKQRGKKS